MSERSAGEMSQIGGERELSLFERRRGERP